MLVSFISDSESFAAPGPNLTDALSHMNEVNEPACGMSPTVAPSIGGVIDPVASMMTKSASSLNAGSMKIFVMVAPSAFRMTSLLPSG